MRYLRTDVSDRRRSGINQPKRIRQFYLRAVLSAIGTEKNGSPDQARRNASEHEVEKQKENRRRDSTKTATAKDSTEELMLRRTKTQSSANRFAGLKNKSFE